jgi:flagellar hook-associated protein 1 FlgK
MASTFFGLNIGLSGLYAYQAAINNTSHNISNAETEGYSRQKLNTTASNALQVNSSYGMAGTGVDILGIEQEREKYYDVKYRSSAMLYGEYSSKNYYMNQVEDYFNELNEGFTTGYTNFFSNLRNLYDNDPSSSDVRKTVTNTAASLTEYMHYMSTSLESIQESTNFEIKNQVDRVNAISEQIATLTTQINTYEVRGGKANDLRDKRELLVDELSEIANTTTEEKVYKTDPMDPGTVSYIVRINGQILVDTDRTNTLQVKPREDKINQTDIDGLYDVYWENGNELDLNNANLRGTLKALYEVRDGNNQENLSGKVTTATTTSGATSTTVVTMTSPTCEDYTKLNIPQEGMITLGGNEYKYTKFDVTIDASGAYTYKFTLDKPLTTDITTPTEGKIGESVNYKGIPYYMSKLNEFTRTFASVFNGMHNTGEDLDGNKGLDFFNYTTKKGASNLIEKAASFSSDGTATDASGNVGVAYYNMTAANFSVTTELLDDPRRFAAANDVSQGVESKKVLEKLLKIETDKTLFKAGTPAQFYSSLVAEIGVDADKFDTFTKSQENIKKSISNQRLSVSGVDIDEEAMNLVKYQNAYNLSAKVIQVMDEIYDKLINGTGA